MCFEIWVLTVPVSSGIGRSSPKTLMRGQALKNEEVEAFWSRKK